MSSRAWTEVATGAKARGARRWVGRAGLPIVLRYVMLISLVVVAGLAFGEVLPRPNADCFDLAGCSPPHGWDLLDLLF
jgi:hypothetical protein